VRAPTPASAHWLWETRALAPDAETVFATRSGRLTATRHGGQSMLHFPAVPAGQVVAPPELLSALADARPIWAGLTSHQIPGERHTLAILPPERAVRHLVPDLRAVEQLPAGELVTARTDDARGVVRNRPAGARVGADARLGWSGVAAPDNGTYARDQTDVGRPAHSRSRMRECGDAAAFGRERPRPGSRPP
jgi:hypothetical protein